jgi:general secretion pathway protein G
MFDVDCGRYPTTSEGLAALINRPPDISSGKWQKYLDVGRIPADPWGHPYVYRCPGLHNTNTFDLYSCGPDGKSLSGGDDPDDINNWNRFSPLVTGDGHMEEFPKLPAMSACGAIVFFVVLAVARWERRLLKPEGNLHGVFAFLWVAATPALVLVLVKTAGGGLMEYSLPIAVLGWLPPVLLCTISGSRRGTPFSKACAVMTITVLVLAALTIPTLH